jgi:hypothetical protein
MTALASPEDGTRSKDLLDPPYDHRSDPQCIQSGVMPPHSMVARR